MPWRSRLRKFKVYAGWLTPPDWMQTSLLHHQSVTLGTGHPHPVAWAGKRRIRCKAGRLFHQCVYSGGTFCRGMLTIKLDPRSSVFKPTTTPVVSIPKSTAQSTQVRTIGDVGDLTFPQSAHDTPPNSESSPQSDAKSKLHPNTFIKHPIASLLPPPVLLLLLPAALCHRSHLPPGVHGLLDRQLPSILQLPQPTYQKATCSAQAPASHPLLTLLLCVLSSVMARFLRTRLVASSWQVAARPQN